MDVHSGVKNVARDAVMLGPGCTGTIGKLSVFTNGGDGVKIADGAHDLTIASGEITCDGRYGQVHQDGVQAMAGANILFDHLTVKCATANDAQFRVAQGTQSPDPPTGVVCDGCSFFPGPQSYHDVTIGSSVDSGVENSIVCPGLADNLTFDTTGATSPINSGNSFPSQC
jgi:hypothetical protein